MFDSGSCGAAAELSRVRFMMLWLRVDVIIACQLSVTQVEDSFPVGKPRRKYGASTRRF